MLQKAPAMTLLLECSSERLSEVNRRVRRVIVDIDCTGRGVPNRLIPCLYSPESLLLLDLASWDLRGCSAGAMSNTEPCTWPMFFRLIKSGRRHLVFLEANLISQVTRNRHLRIIRERMLPKMRPRTKHINI